MEKASVFTNFDLAHFLKSKFKELIEFRYMRMVGSDTNVSGTYKGASFLIEFQDNNYLTFFTKNATLFDELVPALREAMNNCEPICCYDLVSADSNYRDDNLITIEWNVICPEERIRDIVNGRAYGKDSKCINISIFGGYALEYFIENGNTTKEKDFVKIK